jgi:hypothetical protein
MVRFWKRLVLWAALTVAVPAFALADTPDDELRTNRVLLSKWRGDPEHYARLKRDYTALQKLPPEKREQLRELDRDLRDEDPDTQARLGRVLDRFTYWLDHLPEADCARVEAAEYGAERLRIVKELREHEWIAHLPRVDQNRIHNAPQDQRPKIIAALHQEESNRRREWQATLLNVEETETKASKPKHVSELPPDIQMYFNRTLFPTLTPGERGRIKAADGKWPELARTILDLSKSHDKPVRFPPAAGPVPRSPTDFKPGEIPEPIAKLIAYEFRKDRKDDLSRADRENVKKLRGAIGKWPDFALAVHDVAKEKKLALPKPLGPCTLEDFHKSARDFYFDKMLPILQRKESESEFERLKKAVGSWPEYPNTFMDIAVKHNLKVPGTFLGGTKEFWESVRAD